MDHQPPDSPDIEMANILARDCKWTKLVHQLEIARGFVETEEKP